ncbi:MAG: arginase family protein [Deltaproteobacteria bacterium]|nr:MAG: arginase family protein [Deltaproteobacteria bacterium]
MSSRDIDGLLSKILCPPGNGVFTVNTAKERKELLHKQIFGKTDSIEESWLESLKNFKDWKKTFILGVCSDCGGGILRGANWGPLFLRLQMLEDSLKKDEFLDLGDVRVIPHLLHDKYLNEETLKNCKNALYQDENSPHPVSPLSLTEYFLTQLYGEKPDSKVFAMGGDHSVSYPLVKAWLAHKKKQGVKTGLVHFDAHTDLLVERLGIDLCFGSWVTHILDGLDSPSLCHQVGIRSSGRDRNHWEKTFGVNQYWANEVKEKGAEEIAKSIISHFKKEMVEEIYVSFDIDAIDSKYASATGTPEPDGLEPYQAVCILEALSSEFKITGADMVEIAPFLQTDSHHSNEPHSTLETGSLLSTLLIRAMNENGNS